MDKNKIELIILTLLIAVGVNYGVYSLYTVRQYQQIKQEKANYTGLEDKLILLQNKKSNLKDARQENELLKEKIAEVNSQIPDILDTPKLVSDFYYACKKYGVTGENITFGQDNQKTDAQSFVRVLPITLKIKGNKKNVEDFIKNLYSITERKLNVQRMSIYETEGNSTSEGITPGLTLIKSQNISAEITFNQYVENSTGKNGEDILK